MDYATQHYIGNYQPTRTKKAKAVAPTIGRVRPLDAKTKGRKRSTEGQVEIRTDSHVANGFLRCSFLPKLQETQTVQASRKSEKTERDFYQSLSQIAEHYGFQPMPSKGYGYPYNMALAMWDAQTKIKQRSADWDNLRLVQDSGKTCFISEERYCTGSTLYYIPIAPLFQMLHDPKRKKTAQLLVSVCNYLYHIADIPYYRQENSYLYWMYEMMTDWVEQDDETEEIQDYKRELRQAKYLGDAVEQKLFNRINLKVFEQRLNHFKSRDTFDRACQKVANDAFSLYRQYPRERIFRNAQRPDDSPESEDNHHETITMDKYISFIADTQGWLYESLSDCINNEFNEYGEIEEPTLCKRFDGKEVTTANLDFENRLFALLNTLCSLLYDYKTIRK